MNVDFLGIVTGQAAQHAVGRETLNVENNGRDGGDDKDDDGVNCFAVPEADDSGDEQNEHKDIEKWLEDDAPERFGLDFDDVEAIAFLAALDFGRTQAATRGTKSPQRLVA